MKKSQIVLSTTEQTYAGQPYHMIKATKLITTNEQSDTTLQIQNKRD